MTAYADTSWWIAYKIADDTNHGAAVEVFHHRRQPAAHPRRHARHFRLVAREGMPG